LISPRPLFDHHTSGLSNFLNAVESCHPGQFAKALKNKKDFLLNVMCTFGCSLGWEIRSEFYITPGIFIGISLAGTCSRQFKILSRHQFFRFHASENIPAIFDSGIKNCDSTSGIKK
jgi:hypothetical protein